MRELMMTTLIVATAAFLFWLLMACVAVNRLRERGAPVSRGFTVLLALVGSRSGVRAALYLLRGKYRIRDPETLAPVVGRARDYGRVIAPAWFVIAGVASLLWLSRVL